MLANEIVASPTRRRSQRSNRAPLNAAGRKRTRDCHRKQDEEEEEARAEHFRVRKGEWRKRKEIGKPWQIFFSSSCDTAFFFSHFLLKNTLYFFAFFNGPLQPPGRPRGTTGSSSTSASTSRGPRGRCRVVGAEAAAEAAAARFTPRRRSSLWSRSLLPPGPPVRVVSPRAPSTCTSR